MTLTTIMSVCLGVVALFMFVVAAKDPAESIQPTNVTPHKSLTAGQVISIKSRVLTLIRKIKAYNEYVSFVEWLDSINVKNLKDNSPKQFRIILKNHRWFVEEYSHVTLPDRDVIDGYKHNFDHFFEEAIRYETYGRYFSKCFIDQLEQLLEDPEKAAQKRSYIEMIEFLCYDRLRYTGIEVKPIAKYVYNTVAVPEGFLYKKEAETYLKQHKYDIRVTESCYDLEEI